MAGTTTARMCVLFATVAVFLAALTDMTNTMDLPYSDDENLSYDMMDRPAGSSGLWQRRTVDTLLEALVLLRDRMGTSTGEGEQQVVKKARNHYLFWRTPIINGLPRSDENSQTRRN